MIVRRALSVAALALAPVLTLTAPVSAAEIMCDQPDLDPKKVVSANLDGGQVVSSGTTGKGDPDGTGTVLLSLLDLDKAETEASFQLSVNNISLPITGAHIHWGRAGNTGVIYETLVTYSDQSDVSGLFYLSKCDAHSVFLHAEDFYVDVHNYDHPDEGAIRGQLRDAR
jgi:hypothetical protein